MDVALDIAGVGRPVVFGFLQLDNMGGGQAAEVLEELQRNLTDKMIADLPLLHGRVFLVENMIFMLHGRVFLVHNSLPPRFCHEHAGSDGEEHCRPSRYSGRKP